MGSSSLPVIYGTRPMKSATSVWSAALLRSAMLCAIPITGMAAPPSFLNHTILARIPAADIPALRSRIGDVLNHGADGASAEWASTPRPSRPPVQMVLTPLQSVQTQSANGCRLLDARVTQARAQEQWQFWFCKQKDGSWKASGSDLPR